MQANTELLHPQVAASIERHGLVVEIMACDPDLADTAAFCDHYKVSPDETCNTIVVVLKTDPVKYVCCVVLATHKLDVNKGVSSLVGVKRCSFASGEQTIEQTNMVIGGVTPVGIDNMPIYLDIEIMQNARVVLGGGNRTSKLIANPTELTKLPNVQVVEGLGIRR